MRYSRYIITAILFFMGFLSVFSQRNVKSGGKTVRQQKCSPIKSTELKSLRTKFYIAPRAYYGTFEGTYSIELQPSDNGKYTLSCNNETAVVSGDILTKVQEIIKKYDLEKKNGLYSVTAGLPPECQPMHFTAEYVSGEKLNFTYDNNPYSEWTCLLFRLFRNELIAQGNTKYIAPKEEFEVHRLSLEYSAGDGILYTYDNIFTEDDVENLYFDVFDRKNNKDIKEVSVPVPANYYKGINELVEKLELYWLEKFGTATDTPDPKSHRYLCIQANNANGQNLFKLIYVDDDMTDDVKAIQKTLLEYMNKPFDKKK